MEKKGARWKERAPRAAELLGMSEKHLEKGPVPAPGYTMRPTLRAYSARMFNV